MGIEQKKNKQKVEGYYKENNYYILILKGMVMYIGGYNE